MDLKMANMTLQFYMRKEGKFRTRNLVFSPKGKGPCLRGFRSGIPMHRALHCLCFHRSSWTSRAMVTKTGLTVSIPKSSNRD